MSDKTPTVPTGAPTILERLVGDTGDPQRVVAAARALAERALKSIVAGLDELVSRATPIDIQDIEVGRIADVVADSGPYSAVAVAASMTSPDALVMKLDAAAIAVLVDSFFGADADLPPHPFVRDLTQMEIDVTDAAFQKIAAALDGPGERSLQVRFPVPPPIAGRDLAKLALRDGPAAHIVLTLGKPPAVGRLTVTMPQRVLIRYRTDGKDERRQEEPASAWAARFNEEVMRSAILLEATVPLGKMTLGAIAGLSEGQVIELSETAPSETVLSAKNRSLFLCEFGRLGQNYTVRIKHPFDGSQDLIDGLLAS